MVTNICIEAILTKISILLDETSLAWLQKVYMKGVQGDLNENDIFDVGKQSCLAKELCMGRS